MNTKDLLCEIAKCKEIQKVRTGENKCCDEIVRSQGDRAFHLPEPWNGNIGNAEILFISSNPSIAPIADTEKARKKTKYSEEKYPTETGWTVGDGTWNDDDLVDFFKNRFVQAKKRNEKPSKYWNAIFKYSNWMLNGARAECKFKLQDSTIEKIEKIQEKIAITEIVHCKSSCEKGVKKACLHCVKKWMKEILNAFTGKLILVVGKKAENMCKEVSEISQKISEREASGAIVKYIPHPCSGIKTDEELHKMLTECYKSVYPHT